MKKTAPPKKAMALDQVLSEAWQAFSEGKAADAGKLCADMVKAFPGHAHAWHLRGLAALALDKPKQALEYLGRVKDAPDLLPSVTQASGRAQLALGEHTAAASLFQTALDYKPDNAPTHHLLALAMLAQGDAANARKSFRRATRLDPTMGAAHYEVGVLDLAAGDFKAAVAAFALAAQYLPLVAPVANNLALAHQAAGDTNQAEQWFRRALELDSKYAEAWFNLAGLLKSKGDAQAAQEAFSQALMLNPALQDAVNK